MQKPSIGNARNIQAVLSIGLVVVGVLLFVRLAFSEAQQANHDFVIQNVRIFDGSSVVPKGEVWVQNGVIKAVGAHVHAPVGVRTIDGTGKTLLPGLIDAHAHTYGNALKDALVFGVTTELDMFTDYHFVQQVKRQQAEGKDLDSADLRSAGTLVTAPKGHGTEYGVAIPTITSPDEAQTFVDARIAEGSDYIKIVYDDGKAYGTHIPTISKQTMAAVIAAAHKRGKLAVVHIGTLQDARDAIDAGADGLAHLFIDAPPDPHFAAFVASHHAFVVPTLSVLASVSGEKAGKSLAEDGRLQPYLAQGSLTNLQRTFPRSHGAFANPQAAVRELKAHKVPILAGTDAPNPGTTHGASLHGELELLVQAGLTPLEALRSATSIPADAFHLDDRGRIAVGKRADLVLVQGDPTAEITGTRNIVSVWKVGVEDDRASYRATIEKQKAAAEALKKAPAPGGAESGLISDFDDGTTKASFGLGWQVSTDSIRGGTSQGQMHVVDGGAENSKSALQIEGDVAPGGGSWSGAMFFPGTQPMMPVNLSTKKAITFWTKGDGRNYSVLVFSQANGYLPAMKGFVAGPEWKQVTFPLSEFNTDGHDVTGIFFGAQAEPGKFSFLIDGVRLE